MQTTFDIFTIKRYISFHSIVTESKKKLSSENLSSFFFSYITVIIQRYRVYAVERAKDRYFSIEKWEIIIAFQELTDQLSEYTVITIFVHQHGFTVHFLGSANKIVRNDRPCIYVPVSRHSFTTRGLFNKLRYIFLWLARIRASKWKEKDRCLGTRNERLKLYPTFTNDSYLLSLYILRQ